MSNQTYRELRQKSAEAAEQEELEFEVEEAKQQLAGDIHETKKELSKARKRLAQEERKHPFSSEAVVKAELCVEGYEAGLERLLRLQKRLFPEVQQEGETLTMRKD